MTSCAYANIIIDISHEKVDRLFQYRIPDRLKDRIEIGCPVEVPFGKGNTLRKGYVLELTDEANWDPDKIKEIVGVPKDNLSAEDISIKLAAWMKRYYGSTMIAALKTVLPSVKKQNRPVHKFVSLKLPLREATEYYYEVQGKKNQRARERIMKELLDSDGERIPYEMITEKLNVSAATLKSLADKGIIRIEEEEYYRKPVAGDSSKYGDKILSPAQQHIVDTVSRDLDEVRLKSTSPLLTMSSKEADRPSS